MDRNARRHLAKLSDGDARKCLNALEIGVLTTPCFFQRRSLTAVPEKSDAGTAPLEQSVIRFTLAVAEESIQQKAVVYDRVGDAHYDTISTHFQSKACALRMKKARCAFSGKMLHAGEDFRFIARRIVIFASGRASVLLTPKRQLAIAMQQAVELFGMPERASRARDRLHVSRGQKSRSVRLTEHRGATDRGRANESHARAS